MYPIIKVEPGISAGKSVDFALIYEWDENSFMKYNMEFRKPEMLECNGEVAFRLIEAYVRYFGVYEGLDKLRKETNLLNLKG